MSGPRSTFLARVEWMTKHPEVWKDWPSTPDRFIISKLQAAGLVSSHTSAKYMDISKIVSAAKHQMNRGK